jgi:hypothetical protein
MDPQTKETIESLKTELARLKKEHPEQYLELVKTLSDGLDRILGSNAQA